jgi:hypothetical protein
LRTSSELRINPVVETLNVFNRAPFEQDNTSNSSHWCHE